MNTIEYMKNMGIIESFVKQKVMSGHFPFSDNGWNFHKSKNGIVITYDKMMSNKRETVNEYYDLKDILGINISKVDLQKKTLEILKFLSKKGIITPNELQSLEVSYGYIKIIRVGEDSNDFSAGTLISLSELYDILDLSYEMAVQEKPFGDCDLPISKSTLWDRQEDGVDLDLILNELQQANFLKLLDKKVYLDGEASEYKWEHYYLFTNKAGAIVTLNVRKDDYYDGSKANGSIFVFTKDTSRTFQSILKGWDGGGTSFRKDIYKGFSADLEKAWELRDSEWVYGIYDEDCLFTFSICSGLKCLGYLGGYIREKNGGKNRYIMLQDIYGSSELSTLLNAIETKIIFNLITRVDKEFHIPECFDSYLSKHKQMYVKKWEKLDNGLFSKCYNIVKRTWGVN